MSTKCASLRVGLRSAWHSASLWRRSSRSGRPRREERLRALRPSGKFNALGESRFLALNGRAPPRHSGREAGLLFISKRWGRAFPLPEGRSLDQSLGIPLFSGGCFTGHFILPAAPRGSLPRSKSTWADRSPRTVDQNRRPPSRRATRT